MKYVNQPVRKTDAMSLVTGKPVYTKQVLPRRWPELHVSLPIKMCLRNVLPLPARLHRR